MSAMICAPAASEPEQHVTRLCRIFQLPTHTRKNELRARALYKNGNTKQFLTCKKVGSYNIDTGAAQSIMVWPSVPTIVSAVSLAVAHASGVRNGQTTAGTPMQFHDDSTVSFQERTLQNDAAVCTEIPSETMWETWEWARGRVGFGDNRLSPATGMLVYQNDVKIFEEYAPENVCPLFCIIPFFRDLWNMVFRFGGSPTQKASLYSGTKSFSSLCAVMLVKQGHLRSLDDKVSLYVEEWRSDPNKVDITVRELLTLTSGIFSNFFPLMSLWTSLHGPFLGRSFAYGHEPFVVFAYLVKLLTGRSSEQYLADEVFGKLGAEVAIDSIGIPGDVSNLYSGGYATLPDLYKIGNELVKAWSGEGTLFLMRLT